MAKQRDIGRTTQAKRAGKENIITKGGIESAVEGFMGDITTSAPFKPTYGDHKAIGSEMLPTEKGGRGSAGEWFRGKLMDPLKGRKD